MSCPICRAQREAAARGEHKTIADVLRDAAELERFHDEQRRREREGVVQLEDGREVRPMRDESEEFVYTEEAVNGALFVGAITDEMVVRAMNEYVRWTYRASTDAFAAMHAALAAALNQQRTSSSDQEPHDA